MHIGIESKRKDHHATDFPPGLVEIRSLDLDRDLDYYLNVRGCSHGAGGQDSQLKGWDERHAYSFALTESDRRGMVRMGIRTVDPEDLDYREAVEGLRNQVRHHP